MKVKSNTEFHPTLVIGLGGTGHGVLLELKKRLIEQFGEVPPIIQFLAFDTAEPIKRSEKTSSGEAVELEVNKERFVLRVEDPSSILGAHNPHIQQWWPHGTLVSEIISGATQIRARGRLALFANYIEIKDLITRRLTEVRKIDNMNVMRRNRFSVSQRRNVEVFIVSSLAGGTGSGMFMDVAFTTRYILSSTNVVGMFVLPRVFTQLPGTPFVKLNSYAALKEIEYFSKLKDTDRVSVDYGSNKVNVRRPPFDLVYILDSINEQERVMDDPEVLFSRIAHGIYIQIGSEMGASNRNVMDNIIGTLDSAGIVENRSVRYCSFGVSSCTWRHKEFIRMFKARKLHAARQLITKLLETAPDDADYNSDAKRFAQTLNLTSDRIDRLIRRLSEESEGRQLNFELPLNLTYNREAGNRVRTIKERFIDESQGKIKSVVELNYNKIREELREALNGWQKDISSKPGFISYTSNFLKHLADEIVQSGQVIAKELARSQDSLSQIDYTELGTALNKAARARFRVERKMRDACINYAGQAESQGKLILKEEQYQKAFQLASTFLAYIKSLQAWCEDFKSKLQQVSDSLGNAESSHTDGVIDDKWDNPFEHLLDVLPEITDRPVGPTHFIRWCIEKEGSFAAFLERSTVEIQSDVMNFIHDSWGVPANITINDILAIAAKKGNPLDLSYLSHLAAPLWRFNSSEIPLSRRTINRLAYCSVKDGDSQQLENSKGGWFSGAEPEFIAAADDHQITFFNVTEGVPLFALQGIREMESDYYALGNGACHLHRDWKSLPDITPKHLTSDICCFAVAQAPCFSFIKKDGQGVYSVLLNQDGLPAREVPLSAVITEAYAEFNKRLDISQKIRTAIESKIDEQGWFITKENLEKHIDDLSNHMSTNGTSPPDQEFIQREIEAIREYLIDVSG